MDTQMQRQRSKWKLRFRSCKNRLMSDMLLLNSRLKQVTGRVRSDGHIKVGDAVPKVGSPIITPVCGLKD
jgi:hypothetical protein